MPASIQFLGITFHFYGLLIGLSVVMSLYLTEWVLKHYKLSTVTFWQLVPSIVVTGIIGARTWHVMTDWQVYQDNPIASLYLWNGGLSILGAVLGGMLGVWFATKRVTTLTFFQVSDAIVLSLPLAQAVGRVGNWVNQELYGPATTLPWKIYISAEKRLPGYENYSYFHPLFAYEIVVLLVIATVLWLVRKRRVFENGKGSLTLMYFSLYGVARFFLEFLRLDKKIIFEAGLGLNQLLVGLVAIATSTLLILRLLSYTSDEKK